MEEFGTWIKSSTIMFLKQSLLFKMLLVLLLFKKKNIVKHQQHMTTR